MMLPVVVVRVDRSGRETGSALLLGHDMDSWPSCQGPFFPTSACKRRVKIGPVEVQHAATRRGQTRAKKNSLAVPFKKE